MIASTVALTATALAGCSEGSPDGSDDADGGTSEPTDDGSDATTDEPPEDAGETTERETETTDDGADTTSDDADTTTDEGSGDPDPDGAVTHLETVYEAWAALDADAFLATLHATNNHPEEEVRGGANNIDFGGELVSLDAEVLEENLDEDAISTFFETGPNLDEGDVSTFTGVRNLLVRVDPTVEGEASNGAQTDFKNFLETEKRHFLAVEDGEWRFVL